VQDSVHHSFSCTEFGIAGYYDPGRFQRACSQDNGLSCRMLIFFLFFVALCYQNTPKLQTHRTDIEFPHTASAAKTRTKRRKLQTPITHLNSFVAPLGYISHVGRGHGKLGGGLNPHQLPSWPPVRNYWVHPPPNTLNHQPSASTKF